MDVNKARFIEQSYSFIFVHFRCLRTSSDWLKHFGVSDLSLRTLKGRDQLDAGLVGLCITYALSLTRFLNFLIRQLAQVEANIVSVERVETYLNVSTLLSPLLKPDSDGRSIELC